MSRSTIESFFSLAKSKLSPLQIYTSQIREPLSTFRCNYIFRSLQLFHRFLMFGLISSSRGSNLFHACGRIVPSFSSRLHLAMTRFAVSPVRCNSASFTSHYRSFHSTSPSFISEKVTRLALCCTDAFMSNAINLRPISSTRKQLLNCCIISAPERK